MLTSENDRQLSLLGGHGILTNEDLRDLSESEKRVLDLMSDGRWYSAESIELAAGRNGAPAREGLRRMRELRKLGFRIERRRGELGLRVFLYRLIR